MSFEFLSSSALPRAFESQGMDEGIDDWALGVCSWGFWFLKRADVDR
jgi:hypothetical protein